MHDVDAALFPMLDEIRPDIVWPILHGAYGEDGSLRDVLELLNISYVGTRPPASRMAWNKMIAQSVVGAAGISTPQSAALPQSLFRELGAQPVLEAVVAQLGLPLVVKPVQGGSALGVSVVRESRDLPRAMVDCFAYGDIALIEQFIDGTELAVSVIDDGSGPRTLARSRS